MTEHDSVAWLRHYRKEISPLGEKVAFVLGKVYDGIYHANTEVLHKRCQWDDDYCIQFVGGLLVMPQIETLISCCKEKELIVNFTGAAHNYLRISFWHKETGRDRRPTN